MRVRRLPVTDVYVEGDEAVVFVGGNVVALSALATTALLAIDERGSDSATIAARLVHRFGAPPEGVDALEMAESTLRALAEQSIIEVR